MLTARRMKIAGSVLAVAACAAAVGAQAGAETQLKTQKITVADDFFAPTDVKIGKGDKVKWVWASDNTNTHNVVLNKGPKGVDKDDFRSSSGAVGLVFKRKFSVTGTYSFICTYHRSVMKQSVKVKK
jgi:plastocyanin